jgi:hypothetical protein
MAGIDADVTIGPLEVVASVGASLDRFSDHLDRQAAEDHARRERARARVPMRVRFNNSAISDAGADPLVIDVGGPEAGFYWLARRLLIGGVTWKSAVGGTAEIYVSAGGHPWPLSRNLSDMVDQATSLPSKAFYSNEQILVHPREKLYVIVDTPTASTQYIVSSLFEVHRDIAAGEVFEA